MTTGDKHGLSVTEGTDQGKASQGWPRPIAQLGPYVQVFWA